MPPHLFEQVADELVRAGYRVHLERKAQGPIETLGPDVRGFRYRPPSWQLTVTKQEGSQVHHYICTGSTQESCMEGLIMHLVEAGIPTLAEIPQGATVYEAT